MSKRTHMLAAAAVALAATMAFSVPASAGTAWSVSIAGPGYAVTTGAWGPRYYGPYRPGYPHWHRAYVPARVVYSAPLVVAPRVVYPAPAVVYPAPRVIYPGPVVVRPW